MSPRAHPADPFLRQRDILTPEDLRGHHVDLAGAGALGGAISMCMCKMGFGIHNTITLTDFDRCAPHNLGAQWFRPSDVLLERPKVEALAEMLAFVTDREVVAIDGRLTGAEPRRLGPIVILAVDSLDERRRIWDNLQRRDDVRLLLDARMGAEVAEIRAVDLERDDGQAYARSLDDRGDPYRAPCAYQAVLYTTFGAAAFVGSILRAWVRKQAFPREILLDFRNFLFDAVTVA